MPSRPVTEPRKRKSGFSSVGQQSTSTPPSDTNGLFSPRPKKFKSRRVDEDMATTCNQMDGRKDKEDGDDDNDGPGHALPPRRASQFEPMDILIFDDEKDSDYQPGSQESMQPPESTRRVRRGVDPTPAQASARLLYSPKNSGTPPAHEVPSSSPISEATPQDIELGRPKLRGPATPTQSAPQAYKSQLSPTREAGSRCGMEQFVYDQEMEEWEVAPGVAQVPGQGQRESIAFSTPFLRSNKVQVFPGTACEIIIISPGQSRSWDPMPAKRSLATIMYGKLRIKSYGEEFDLGPGGMFKVQEAQSGRDATTTVAENGWYIDAVLQLLTLELDMCSCGQ